jgi:DNA-binding NarL/FixJ family response regulator
MISELDIKKLNVKPLSPTEMRVLVHLCDGLVNKVIADRMCVSDHTIKFHVNNIVKKLRAQTRTEAAVRAIRIGLLQ